MSAQPDVAPDLSPASPRLVAVPHVIAPDQDASALRAARLRRKLTEEEVAARAGLFPDEVRWLEAGRVYRFRSSEDALLAAVLYSAALGIGRREARGLAGIAPPPGRLGRSVRGLALAGLLTAVVAALVLPAVFGRSPGAAPGVAVRAQAGHGPVLPPPARLTVDVLNGNGDINWTRKVAKRVGALGYRIGRVVRAGRFDYTATAVYFEPGGRAFAQRLAGSLGAPWKALPAGKDPRRLVVIVGPQRGPG